MAIRNSSTNIRIMDILEQSYYIKMASWHLDKAEMWIMAGCIKNAEWHQKKAKKMIKKARN